MKSINNSIKSLEDSAANATEIETKYYLKQMQYTINLTKMRIDDRLDKGPI